MSKKRYFLGAGTIDSAFLGRYNFYVKYIVVNRLAFVSPVFQFGLSVRLKDSYL
jgi:hypothetical protein